MKLELLDKTNQTRIKVSRKEYEANAWLRKLLTVCKPERDSSRYLYFLAQGDLLNCRKK